MFKNTFSALILTLILVVSITAQEKFVEDELIIRIENGVNERQVASDFEDIELIPFKLLSKRMNIWLFKYATDKIDNSDILYKVRISNKVKEVQRNHYIERRIAYEDNSPTNTEDSKLVFPNDPRFSEQWALNNTGQSGGTVDADIDAVEAWDLSFGGPTALGDEVVVAIIDGGCDINHPDINFFKNELEIPNNGIDDDNNGYVDDYDGWDAYSSDGSVPSDGHGTHVAGIAAAIGNNNLGVIGVNPNAKILPIAGSSGTESIVVEAYGYVLEMRERYNESNGTEGAFIVSTNASFGVDYGNPANYPIWCGIYDDLGAAGVLNCGATANLNINIDVQGDVPTACGSDYMIAVTNTTRTDSKNSGAAYGATTIDLGAPGTSILSTYPSNSYSSLTGTSMATPTVTGAIALLYSAANPALMQSYKENPGLVALQMRQFLLDGVDPIDALEGITVTGGRLNIFNSLLNVIAEPDEIPPTTISDLVVVDSTSNSLTLAWTVPTDTTRNGVVGYDIRYSTSPITDSLDFANATEIMFEDTPNDAGEIESLVIINLPFSTEYYFAIKSNDFWMNVSEMSNVVSGKTFDAPKIEVTPTSLNASAEYAQEILDTIKIFNNSAASSTLDYSVELANNSFPADKINVKLVPQQLKLNANSKSSKNIKNYFGFRKSGGPDNFGYEWIDSNEPNGPQFIWNDISSTGNEATNWTSVSTFNPKDEGYSGPFNIGFNFKYYGVEYSQVYVNANGFLTFLPYTSSSYSNSILPGTAGPNGIIAAFWDDLDGSNGNGKVYYKADDNKFIIQYTDWKRYSSSSSGTFTFQIVLNSSGTINYYYYSINGTKTESVIGFENETGTDGLTIDFRSGYAENNLAVKIAAEPEWMNLSEQSGTLYNSYHSNLIISFSSSIDLLPGLYQMDVLVKSNDPLNSEITIPVSYNLGGVVPVELTSFTADIQNESVMLKWITVTETNNQGFEVERSVNNKEWNKIGYVAGNGNSTEKIEYLFVDKIERSGKFYYRLKQIDYDGTINFTSSIEAEIISPLNYSLEQNFPNPFNPSTNIKYSIASDDLVTVKVYDVLGNEIAMLVNQRQDAGKYEILFDASKLSSGIYIYSITTSNYADQRKMLLIK